MYELQLETQCMHILQYLQVIMAARLKWPLGTFPRMETGPPINIIPNNVQNAITHNLPFTVRHHLLTIYLHTVMYLLESFYYLNSSAIKNDVTSLGRQSLK